MLWGLLGTVLQVAHSVNNHSHHFHIVESNKHNKESLMDDLFALNTNQMQDSIGFLELEDKEVLIELECKSLK